ncbi:ChaC-like protein [Phakopsora pachyrhizi]|uniref:glutathione-specific gamma-glutamylcyclotransferase n=1 Tax=Phakopsora pachyrhizi TaxID=170000 RepID=A0AAV0BAN5_PHAPC|nr:ChaC-like protein [Phakopsora pachyrhizi]
MEGFDYIFGYGSLIWKPPPHVIENSVCYIKGYTRRMAQYSHDHRGTPENPGVVVTLVPTPEWKSLPGSELEDLFINSTSSSSSENSHVYGLVYKIDPRFKKQTKEYLDEREKDGYETTVVELFTKDSNNQEKRLENFCGPKDLNQLAQIIQRSHGILFKLNEEILRLCPHVKDEYLIKLDELLKI